MATLTDQRWHVQHETEVHAEDETVVAECVSAEVAEAIVTAHNIVLMSMVISQNITLEKQDNGALLLDLNTDLSALNNHFNAEAVKQDYDDAHRQI